MDYPLSAKERRLEAANTLLREVANCGRRFFWYHRTERVAFFSLDWGGRVHYTDEVTGQRINTHCRDRHAWRQFSHGGTLRQFIEDLRDYIATGNPLSAGYFDGDQWGYGEHILTVITVAFTLGILERRPNAWHKEAPCS